MDGFGREGAKVKCGRCRGGLMNEWIDGVVLWFAVVERFVCICVVGKSSWVCVCRRKRLTRCVFFLLIKDHICCDIYLSIRI